MFLNFTNINDYKDQTIGLNLIDSKSLRDLTYDSYFGAGGSLNDAQLKQYYFAEFDSVNNQFQIRFNIPANTIPGRLDFVLSFSNKVHIYSPSLPNSYQLYVYPLSEFYFSYLQKRTIVLFYFILILFIFFIIKRY